MGERLVTHMPDPVCLNWNMEFDRNKTFDQHIMHISFNKNNPVLKMTRAKEAEEGEGA